MGSDPLFQRGNAALLAGQPIAFFCSQSCPGDIILRAQDWANARGPDDAPVISGFHTPVERDVLRILLRGGAPVIQVRARALDGARLPAGRGTRLEDEVDAQDASVLRSRPGGRDGGDGPRHRFFGHDCRPGARSQASR